jgi:DNA-binding PadR family transcriptional regulator
MHRRHGFRHGFVAGYGEEFGPGFAGAFGRRGHRFGGRARGEIKYEILAVLETGPRHGYDIMLAIEGQSGIRPSPGSIYPALQMLEDGDFVRSEEHDGKRVYTITDKGRELLQGRPQAEGDAGAENANNIYGIMADAMRQVHGIKDAAKHIARSGDIELFRKALKVLDRTRRDLYAILAGESESE